MLQSPASKGLSRIRNHAKSNIFPCTLTLIIIDIIPYYTPNGNEFNQAQVWVLWEKMMNMRGAVTPRQDGQRCSQETIWGKMTMLFRNVCHA